MVLREVVYVRGVLGALLGMDRRGWIPHGMTLGPLHLLHVGDMLRMGRLDAVMHVEVMHVVLQMRCCANERGWRRGMVGRW